jgi:hypothetical protein
LRLILLGAAIGIPAALLAALYLSSARSWCWPLGHSCRATAATRRLVD